MLLVYKYTYTQNVISGKIIYEASLQVKPNSKTSAKTEKYIKNMSNVSFQLMFNNEASIYKKVEMMNSEYNSEINITAIVSGGNDVYYFENKEQLMLRQTESFGEQFLITCKGNDWKIGQDKKYIGNYLCYKATIIDEKGNEIVSWFTTEIPVSFGPKKYYGLPGLILELNVSGLTIKAVSITLNPKNKINIKKLRGGQKITEEEFYKTASKMIENLNKF